MILTITKVTQEFTKTGAEYRKVTGNDKDGKETTKSVFDNLKFLWPLLVEGKEIELKLVQKGQFWNVINIKPADEPWPEDTDLVEPKEVAKKPEPKTETKEPAPQEIGMWWKEVGENYRASKLEGATGKAIMLAYWAKLFAVLGIEREK